MKLADLSAVNGLNASLDLLTSARSAATNGRLTLSAAIDGSNFNFGLILDSEQTRAAVQNMIEMRISDAKGKLRQLGVDPDA